MARRLKWVMGKSCNGQTYYLEAKEDGKVYTLSKSMVSGAEKYSLYKDKDFVKMFEGEVGRKEALKFAETL